MTDLRLELPVSAELVDRIAERAAAIVLERLGGQHSEPELMTIEEAAEYLRCRPQRIYDLRSDGRLSRLSDGSRALVSRAELVALALPNGNGSRMARRVTR